jgi:hypothetical protein
VSTRPRLIGASAAWATGLGLAVLACSSNSARPPELGDCVKTTDAACPTPDPGLGSGVGPGDGGTSDTGTVDEGVSGCGTAQNAIVTQNLSCVPCIEGTDGTSIGCCGADLACSAQTDCITLLECMVGCSGVGCATCENNAPAGVQAYNDLAQCISQNCSPQCPALPQAGTADF